MPIPQSFDDLDTNPNNNSPQGSETLGPNANGYIQAAMAFIKQIYDGVIVPDAAVDVNGQKITSVANGAVSSTSKDAVNGSQLAAINKVGDQKMWHGAVANITAVQGPGWQLADGTNGTADMRGKFVVGQDGTATYPMNGTGGANTVALATANMPAHAHGVTDPTHAHAVSDPSHAHGVNDPSHTHGFSQGSGSVMSHIFGGGTYSVDLNGPVNTDDCVLNYSGTGVSIQGAFTGVQVAGHATGISIQSAGSGTAFDARPPYYATCILEYTGIGV